MSMSFPICEKMDDTLIENGRKLFAAEWDAIVLSDYGIFTG